MISVAVVSDTVLHRAGLVDGKRTVKKISELLRKANKKDRARAKVTAKVNATGAGGAESQKQKINLKT